ncbi:ATP-dependent helicase [Tepidiforma bonchosmolovskayae]|uniref:DNA 3'-5' helicase n=1 Tax=Tepidiforma bonchosmolovskayae TaxID=2601677 RepID=A0ABX6BZY0_9CHLR|nr:UvrD-helicase domain-containing protein [Tepidiforma bonchosmolovskayae]QFG01953.1 AAA family ATPase [Tepidiforma bonchosmolovskayae]
MSAPTGTADILAGLNDAQRAAVTHGDGALLILAGPGSGKTRVITHRIGWLIRERRIAPWRILAVTFTNKAAREMRERAARLIGEDAEAVHMGTFHAMCARWLRIDGEAVGVPREFAIYDDSDQLGVVKRVLEELRIDPRQFAPRGILSRISAAKSEMLTPEVLLGRVRTYQEEVAARVYERYDAALRRAGALDFDDLLLRAVELLRVPAMREKWAGRYEHVLVDEFQDTNPAQYVLARELASVHRNITVVGDPDQGIYSWRSADIRNVEHFRRDFPEATVVLLEQNYRSTAPILRAAEAVIARNPGRHPRRLWTERTGGEPIVTYEAYNDEEEGEFVAREVGRLVAAGRSYRDIAVLYRTNAQSRPFEEALVRHRIPYRLVGGVRFYERREIRELLAYFRVIHNPADEASLGRIINVPGRGIGERTVDRLRELAAAQGTSLWEACRSAADGRAEGIGSRAAAALRGFVATMEELREHRDEPLGRLFERLINAVGYVRYLEEGDDAEERMENVLELQALLAEYEETAGEGNDLATFLQDVALVTDQDTLDGRGQGVTLITLHAAKGLEFPVVFLVGMEEGLLPHIRSFDDPQQMAEERRLCYVGMTRAMDLLYLTRAYRRMTFGASAANPPSRFLADVPAEIRRPYGNTTRGYVEAAAALVDTDDLEPAETPVFPVGTRVVHPKFGEGVVTDARANGSDTEYVVEFNTAGTRRLLQSYAKLRAL